jgi:hypothetical protein
MAIYGNIISIRESTFIMPRGDEDVKGAPKYFLALKEALKILDIPKRGAINFSKFWSSPCCSVHSHYS